MREALQGILIEGKQAGQPCEAQWIFDRYISIPKDSLEGIGQACVHLYTMDNFLYRLVNTTLGENDLSKVDTLGAFCYLLFQFNVAQEFNHLKFIGRVYRGAKLSPSIIEEYQHAVGGARAWLGLTPTTRDRRRFCPIDSAVYYRDSAYCSGRAIACLPTYPHEDEVLLRAGTHFTIDRVEPYSSETNNINTLIYLTVE